MKRVIFFTVAMFLILWQNHEVRAGDITTQQATLTVNTVKSKGKISPLIFGADQELAHFVGAYFQPDNQFVWALWDGKISPSKEEIRNQHNKVLVDTMKELRLPCLRFKGFHRLGKSWKEAIQIINLVLEYCKEIGTEPLFDYSWVPEGFQQEGNLNNSRYMNKKELVDLVEYCNSKDTSKGYGKLRLEQGYSQPFNVKYWVIGDEAWHFSKHYYPDKNYTEEYARSLIDWGKAMREVSDIEIVIGADGSRWQPDWNRKVIEIAGNEIGFIGDHPVFPGGEPPEGKEVHLSAIASPRQLTYWMQDIQDIVKEAKEKGLVKQDKKIWWGQTEYEIWWNPYGDGTEPRDAYLQMVLTMGEEMRVLIENGALLANYHEMAWNRPWALVEFNGFKLGQYYLLDMLINHFGDTLLDHSIKCPTYNMPAFGQLQQPQADVPYLSTCTSRDSKGNIYIFAINKYADIPIKTTINIDNFSSPEKVVSSVWRLTGKSMKSPPEEMEFTKDTFTLPNKAGDPQRVSFTYEFPPRSVVTLKIDNPGGKF